MRGSLYSYMAMIFSFLLWMNCRRNFTKTFSYVAPYLDITYNIQISFAVKGKKCNYLGFYSYHGNNILSMTSTSCCSNNWAYGWSDRSYYSIKCSMRGCVLIFVLEKWFRVCNDCSLFSRYCITCRFANEHSHICVIIFIPSCNKGY